MKRTLNLSSSQRNKICGIFIDKDILSSLSVKSSSNLSYENSNQSNANNANNDNNENATEELKTNPVTIPGVTLVTGKYSSRLREKNFSPLEVALRKSYRGDASLLRSARDVVNSHSQTVKINQEMNKILQYIQSRGIIGWILMSQNDPEDYREELQKSIAGIHGVNLLLDESSGEIDSNGSNGSGGDEISNTIKEIQTKFEQFLPHQTLLVSQRGAILSYGNTVNHLTARFRSQPQSGIFRPHYTIEEVSQIREIIEDINGVSYRT